MDINISELTLDNLGAWPNPVKIAAIVVVFTIIVFLGYWFDHRSQLQQLAAARSQETVLLTTIADKQQQAANLIAYRKQLQQVHKILLHLLRQLPTRSEVPGLLEDISKTGVSNGLEFTLFKPLAEVQGDFYVELPIKISVIGNYHQLANFISQVVGLSRIVTLHDFTIKPKPNSASNAQQTNEVEGKLVLDILAKTYRYHEDGIVQASNNTTKLTKIELMKKETRQGKKRTKNRGLHR